MDNRSVQAMVAVVLRHHEYTEEDIARLGGMDLGISEVGEVGMIAYTRLGTDKRVRTRVGRFVRAHFGEGKTATDIQQIGAEIIALLWVGESVGKEDSVREVSGEDLRNFYLESVSQIHSCMSSREAQVYLDIYVDNPDVVKLATVRIGDQAGRALVWTFPNGRRYMDRMYSSGSDACLVALREYATRGEIASPGRLKASEETVIMGIRHGADSYWPYMDGMVYMTLLPNNRCQLSTTEGEYELQTLDGALEDECCICEGCGDRLYGNNRYLGADGEEYCWSCLHERYTTCDHCGESVSIDDTCRVEIDDADELLCPDCYDTNYHTCQACAAVCKNDDSIDIGHGVMGCPECAETHSVCGQCRTVLQRDSVVDGLCSDCAMSQMETMILLVTKEEV